MMINQNRNKQPDPQGHQVEASEPQAEPRPSLELIKHYLNRSLNTGEFGIDVASKIAGASVELYNRLKPRDTVESLLAQQLVALHNANMESYGAAVYHRSRDENLARAIEGTRAFAEFVTAFEARRASNELADPAPHLDRLQALVDYLDRRDQQCEASEIASTGSGKPSKRLSAKWI